MTRRSLLLAGVTTAAAQADTGIRAGCQTNAWRINPEKFDEVLAVLDKIKGYGYHGFETGFRNVQGQFAAARQARAAIEQRGLRFLGCHIFLLEYDPSTMLAPADLSTRVLNGAAQLGAERLILSGGSVRREGKLDREALRRKSAALNQAGKLCKAKGMVVAYHNHDKEFAAGGEEMEEMLRLTDPATVRLILDAGHAFRAGANLTAFVEKHAARIDGMHLRDFRNDDQVPLGEGTFDLQPLANLLRKRNWSGWVINEEERLNDVKPGDSAIAPARRTLKKVFGV
jgi:sugar phosphate isomerase/epimerase